MAAFTKIKIMEDKTYMIHPIGGKSILRSTGEEVEIIDSEIKERGARSDEDWVTYIDSQGKEHIKEKLNVQLDFKAVANDMLSKLMDMPAVKNAPSTRNTRIYEVAKWFLVNRMYKAEKAFKEATEFVDAVEEVDKT